VSICRGLAAIMNAEFLPAAIAELPHRILALIVAFDIAASP